MSADLYSDLVYKLGMENYPKLTPHMLKSLHWLPCQLTSTLKHEKLPQNDPSFALFHALVSKLHEGCLPCQLICTVTSPLDWA